MVIDFSPVQNKEKRIADLQGDIGKDQLRAASEESIDKMLAMLDGMTDAQLVFDPTDEGADDPYAKEGEEAIGWSLAHLIAHVTASSEEGAAFSSLLARGVAASERPRYETEWRDITTVAQATQRLEESRRMRNAYLDTWPDEPHLNVLRAGTSEGFDNYFGKVNAVGCFLMGLGHEIGHFAQMEEVVRQASA